jgi:hypothetical protein
MKDIETRVRSGEEVTVSEPVSKKKKEEIE